MVKIWTLTLILLRTVTMNQNMTMKMTIRFPTYLQGTYPELLKKLQDFSVYIPNFVFSGMKTFSIPIPILMPGVSCDMPAFT